MLSELLAIVENPEFDEDNEFTCISCVFESDYLKLVFKINFVFEETTQIWEVLCQSPREHTLNFDTTIEFGIFKNHVLLWPHTQPVCSLFFSGAKNDPAPIIGELWQQHYELVGSWIPFEDVINNAQSLYSLIEDGFGMIAKGPQKLIEAYQEILKKYGYKTSFGGHAPKYWDGEKFLESEKVSVLIMGDSYVIASKFEAQKIS